MSSTNAETFLNGLEKDSMDITERLCAIVQKQENQILANSDWVRVLGERLQVLNWELADLVVLEREENATAQVTKMEAEIAALKEKTREMEKDMAKENKKLRGKYDKMKRKYADIKKSNADLLFEEPPKKRRRSASRATKPHPAEARVQQKPNAELVVHAEAEQKHSESDSSSSESPVPSTSSHELAAAQVTVQKSATSKLTDFTCNIGICKKVFTDAEQLANHTRWHQNAGQWQDKWRNRVAPKKPSALKKMQYNGRVPKNNKTKAAKA